MLIIYVLAYTVFLVCVLRRWAPPARRIGADCEKAAKQAFRELDDADGGDGDFSVDGPGDCGGAGPDAPGVPPAGDDGTGSGNVGSDAAPKSVPVPVQNPGRDPALRMRIARAAAMEVKAKVGLLKDTEANNLVVGRIVRDYLAARGLRPTHIAQIAPMATVLALTPMRADVEARMMRATAVAYERSEEYYGDWFFTVVRRYGGWASWGPIRRLIGDRAVEVRHSLPSK